MFGFVRCVTLHGLELVCLYDDAELEHELRCALQEHCQQVEHADVCILVHHPPVKPPAVILSTLPAPDAQVDGVEVPVRDKEKPFKTSLALNPL